MGPTFPVIVSIVQQFIWFADVRYLYDIKHKWAEPLATSYFVFVSSKESGMILQMSRLVQAITCAGIESFARGGPTLTRVFFVTGKRIQIALKAGHHWPPNKTPFKCRFAGEPMMAHH